MGGLGGTYHVKRWLERAVSSEELIYTWPVTSRIRKMTEYRQN